MPIPEAQTQRRAGPTGWNPATVTANPGRNGHRGRRFPARVLPSPFQPLMPKRRVMFRDGRVGKENRRPVWRDPAGRHNPTRPRRPFHARLRMQAHCRRKRHARISGCSTPTIRHARQRTRRMTPATGLRSAWMEQASFQSPGPLRQPPCPLSKPSKAGMFSSLPPKKPAPRFPIVAETPAGCQHNFQCRATCCSSYLPQAVRLRSSKCHEHLFEP